MAPTTTSIVRTISFLAITTVVACSNQSSPAGGTDSDAGSPGSHDPAATPLPDATTEPKTSVPFPRGLEPFAYQAFAVGADGTVTMAASTTLEVVVAGYSPDFSRTFAVATPEGMDHAIVRGLLPRAGGGVVLEYAERDTPKHEGFILTLLSDGTSAHAVVPVPQEAYAVAIDASDRVAFGTAEGADATRKAVVKRVTPDGAPDANFGNAGTSTFACGGPTSAPTAMATGPDGSVFSLVTGSGAVTYLVKLTPSGALDTSFGSAGCATWSFGVGGLNFQAKRIEVDSSAIWLAGSIRGADGFDDGAVVKLLQGGAPDSTFGKGGLVDLVPSSVSSNVVVAAHPSGTGLLVLDSQYLEAGYRYDLIRLDATGQRSDAPVIGDSGFLDFTLTKDGLNLYYLKADLAGRIATP